MSQTSEYRVITGTAGQIETELTLAAVKNWRPILMSTVHTPMGTMVTVILEHRAKANTLLGHRVAKPTEVKRPHKAFFTQMI